MFLNFSPLLCTINNLNATHPNLGVDVRPCDQCARSVVEQHPDRDVQPPAAETALQQGGHVHPLQTTALEALRPRYELTRRYRVLSHGKRECEPWKLYPNAFKNLNMSFILITRMPSSESVGTNLEGLLLKLLLPTLLLLIFIFVHPGRQDCQRQKTEFGHNAILRKLKSFPSIQSYFK